MDEEAVDRSVLKPVRSAWEGSDVRRTKTTRERFRKGKQRQDLVDVPLPVVPCHNLQATKKWQNHLINGDEGPEEHEVPKRAKTFRGRF